MSVTTAPKVGNIGTSESESESEDVLAIVKALKEASHDLPNSGNNVETLIQGLKRLQSQDLLQNSGKLKDPKLRRKLVSLCNLISQLEPQVERARKLTSRRGFKYYLSRAKGKVLGNDITFIAHSMESELQAWLDRQSMEHLVQVLETQCTEEEQLEALAGFEARVKDGYNPELQDVILSSKVFESLSSVLRPGKSSPRVQKEAAFALSALVHFNKDVFVSQILMLGVVESLLTMVTDGSNDLSIGAVSVLGSLVTAGKGALVDEIHSKGGVEKIVKLLDDEYEEMKITAMECVFEMAYYGRKEAVEAMLEADVVKKLAVLQQSEAGGDLIDFPMHSADSTVNSPRKDFSHKSSQFSPNDSSGHIACTLPDSTMQNSPRISKDSLGKSMDFQDGLVSSEELISSSQNALNSAPISRKSSAKSTDLSQGFVESPQAPDGQSSTIEDYWEKHPFASAVSRFAIQLEIGQGLRQREKRALKQEILKRIREAVSSEAEVATIFAEVLWGP